MGTRGECDPEVGTGCSSGVSGLTICLADGLEPGWSCAVVLGKRRVSLASDPPATSGYFGSGLFCPGAGTPSRGVWSRCCSSMCGFHKRTTTPAFQFAVQLRLHIHVRLCDMQIKDRDNNERPSLVPGVERLTRSHHLICRVSGKRKHLRFYQVHWSPDGTLQIQTEPHA